MAFYQNTNLTTITCPNVTAISEQAFYNDTNLTTLECPKATYIGKKSFQNCNCLTKAYCPAATTIDDYAFQSCSALSDLTITQLVTMGDYAFGSCSSLKKVSLPSTLVKIGNHAFEWAGLDSSQNDNETFIIPSSVTTLGTHAFFHCGSLQKVAFEAESPIETIPENCFDGTALTDIALPKNLKRIEHTAFWSCHFTSFEIPDTVTYIAYEAFSQCKNLTSITIPASVAEIGDASSGYGTFNNCTSLTTLIIESSNQRLNIGKYAFTNCSSLKTLTIKKSNYVLDIRDGCFQNTGFENLALSNRTISMGVSVFTGCNSLTTLTFGDADIKMWGSDFKGLTNLKTINFESSSIPLYIGSSCFEGCSGLTSLDFSSRPVWIGQIKDLNNNISSDLWNAFQSCSNLTELKFGSFTGNYNYIGPRAFALCSKLNNITWGNSVQYIRQYAFDSTALTTVNLSLCSNLTALNGFSYCVSLTSVIYPTSITSIGESCFSGSTSLKTVSSSSSDTNGVYLSSSISSIGNSAFSNCTAITIVKSQCAGALRLGASAFSNCTSLKIFSQDTSGSLTYGENVFSSDSALMYIVLPSNFDTNTSNFMLVGGLSQFSSTGSAYICFANGKTYFDFSGDNPTWVKISTSGSDIAKLAYYSGNGRESSGTYYEWSWNTNNTDIFVVTKTVSSTSSNSIRLFGFLSTKKEERLSL